MPDAAQAPLHSPRPNTPTCSSKRVVSACWPCAQHLLDAYNRTHQGTCLLAPYASCSLPPTLIYSKR